MDSSFHGRGSTGLGGASTRTRYLCFCLLPGPTKEQHRHVSYLGTSHLGWVGLIISGCSMTGFKVAWVSVLDFLERKLFYDILCYYTIFNRTGRNHKNSGISCLKNDVPNSTVLSSNFERLSPWDGGLPGWVRPPQSSPMCLLTVGTVTWFQRHCTLLEHLSSSFHWSQTGSDHFGVLVKEMRSWRKDRFDVIYCHSNCTVWSSVWVSGVKCRLSGADVCQLVMNCSCFPSEAGEAFLHVGIKILHLSQPSWSLNVQHLGHVGLCFTLVM